MLHLLKKYSPKHDKYVTFKNILVDNVSKFYEKREKIIKGFKNEVFPLYYDKEYEEQMEFEEEEKEKERIFNVNKFNKWVNKQETYINKELFKNYFFLQRPSALLKELYKTNDKKKNRLLVSVINSGLKDLKEKINKMSEKERKIENADKIVKMLKKFSTLINKTRKEKV